MAVQLQNPSHVFSHAIGLWNLSTYVTFHGYSDTQHSVEINCSFQNCKYKKLSTSAGGVRYHHCKKILKS